MISNDNFLTNNGNFVGIFKPPTTVNGTTRLPTAGGGVYNVNNIYMAVRQGAGFISKSGLLCHFDINNNNSWTSYDYGIQDLTNNYTITRTNTGYNLISGTPSLNFTGNNQYLTHDSSYRISGTGAFSIECWYRPETGGASQPLFFSGSSSVAGYAAVRLTTGTSFGFVGYNGTTNYSITVTPGTTSVYHHYVVTRDASGNVTIYRDVTTTNTGVANFSINPSAANVEYTGYDANVPNTNFMVGYLPIYRVYNRALTSSEILGNFNMERQRFGV